jgi:beta-N-acetylhexosaminidase
VSPVPRSGAFVMVDFPGRSLPTEHADFFSREGIRAVCLFRKNLGPEDEARHLMAQLREVLGPRALIGIDQEGGSVVRATFLPHAPAAMALGAVGDEALAEQVGNAVGRGLRSLGINWDFAPVVDVNSDPRNPVIGERSFSADPRAVAALAGAWIRGALGAGVACCIKHFPGHGDTSVDSHHELPVVDRPMESLRSLELIPFLALRAIAPAVMSAHIVYPRIDPDFPATLSRRILGGLLRGELGYAGVVITDSLVMKAIADRFGHARAAPLALQAGADMAMALGSLEEQEAALRGIDDAIADGSLDQDTLAAAGARLDALAARFPASPREYSAEERVDDERTMRTAWTRALTAIGMARRPDRAQRLRVIAQRSVPGDGVSEAGLEGAQVAQLFSDFADLEVILVDSLPALDWSSLPGTAGTSVLVSNGRVRYGSPARAWRPDLHIALWNPFHVLDVAAPALVTWGYAPGALDALRGWLRGELRAEGRSPVELRAG